MIGIRWLGVARRIAQGRACRGRIVLFLVCLTLAAWLSPTSAGTTKPADVTITTSQVCPSDVATFVAEGAIEDSGNVTYTLLGPAAGLYGVTGVTLKTEAVFTGKNDTFTLRWDVVFKVTDDPDAFAEFGQWRIVAGTGAYAGLTGQGRSSGTCNFVTGIESQILEGQVH